MELRSSHWCFSHSHSSCWKMIMRLLRSLLFVTRSHFVYSLVQHGFIQPLSMHVCKRWVWLCTFDRMTWQRLHCCAFQRLCCLASAGCIDGCSFESFPQRQSESMTNSREHGESSYGKHDGGIWSCLVWVGAFLCDLSVCDKVPCSRFQVCFNHDW